MSYAAGLAHGHNMYEQEMTSQRLVEEAEAKADRQRAEALREQKRQQEEAKESNTWGTVGKIAGTVGGGILGSLIPIPGVGTAMGAMLGASLGGGLGGGIAGLAAPGPTGQGALQGAESLTSGLSPVMSYMAMKGLREAPTGDAGANPYVNDSYARSLGVGTQGGQWYGGNQLGTPGSGMYRPLPAGYGGMYNLPNIDAWYNN